jgi:hypothetical protein
MLSKTLLEMKTGETLYTWSGKLLDCKHSSVRADLVRLRLFHKFEKGFEFREIPPYRPAAVHKGSVQGPDLQRLIFSSEPLFLVRSGSRKGRHAQASDLYRNEDTVRIDLEANIPDNAVLRHSDRSVEHALEICSNMFASYVAAGGVVGNDKITHIPPFLLSSKETAEHLFQRPGTETVADNCVTENGYVYRDANKWYGQGVWCVDPAELGHWYLTLGSQLVGMCPGYEVDVEF